MIARAFDHRDGAGVAHREALAGDAAEVAFALDRAVHHGVADDDRFLRHDAAVGRRPHDDAAAGQALADVVVGLAFELKRDAAREPGAKALPGRTGQLHLDGVVRQSRMAIALGDLARQHRTRGAVGILDRGHDAYRRPTIERGLCLGDQLPVENFVDLVILRLAVVDVHTPRRIRLVKQLEKSRPLAFQCSIT